MTKAVLKTQQTHDLSVKEFLLSWNESLLTLQLCSGEAGSQTRINRGFYLNILDSGREYIGAAVKSAQFCPFWIYSSASMVEVNTALWICLHSWWWLCCEYFCMHALELVSQSMSCLWQFAVFASSKWGLVFARACGQQCCFRRCFGYYKELSSAFAAHFFSHLLF